jgi:hypothetical protein
MGPRRADEPITRISVFLTTQQLDQLRAVNARTGIPVSALIRQGVDRVLAEHAPTAGRRSRRTRR